MTYLLYYWPTIQGRGEFVRLALEAAGADYVDVARGSGEDQGVEALMALMSGKDATHPSFAPPFLKFGEQLIGQAANILLFLGARHGLAPQDEAGRLWTNQLQLTIADLVTQAHDTHHPVGGSLYYGDQQPEARRYAEGFRAERMPKFLGWFETVLARNPAGPDHLVGGQATYADLSLFQVVAGLSYAFPRAMKRLAGDYPHVGALHGAVARLPRIAAYLASERRIPFNEDGIFRHYDELDDPG